jgi:hypothetical protein
VLFRARACATDTELSAVMDGLRGATFTDHRDAANWNVAVQLPDVQLAAVRRADSGATLSRRVNGREMAFPARLCINDQTVDGAACGQ